MKGMADSLGDLGWPMEDPYLGPQHSPRAQWPLLLPPGVDHPPAALPHLLAGPWRPCHGGAYSGPLAWVHLRPGVLVLLDCSRCHSSAPSSPATTVVTSRSSSPRAERGWGPWRGTWSRSWGQHDTATFTRCTLTNLPPMQHGYGYMYRYRLDTDTRIRHFSKIPIRGYVLLYFLQNK